MDILKLKKFMNKDSIVIRCHNKSQLLSFMEDCIAAKIPNFKPSEYRYAIENFDGEICFRIDEDNKITYDSMDYYINKGDVIVNYMHGDTPDYFPRTTEEFHIRIHSNKKGDTIKAEMLNGFGRVIKAASAKCHKDDDFDYDYGKQLALARLLGFSEPDTPLVFYDIENKKACGEVGQKIETTDISDNNLHVGDIVRIHEDGKKSIKGHAIVTADKNGEFQLTNENTILTSGKVRTIQSSSMNTDGTGMLNGTEIFVVRELPHTNITNGHQFNKIVTTTRAKIGKE